MRVDVFDIFIKTCVFLYTRTFYFSVRVYVYAYYVEFTFSNHALLPIIFLRVKFLMVKIYEFVKSY